MTRRVAVFTGTRADYGLLRGLALEIDRSLHAELLLLVSGSHLVDGRGTTSDEIARDGLTAAAEIPIWSGDDSPMGAAADVGAAIPRYAAALVGLAPDVVVVLGDRLEAFALATAATIVGIPVAHIHGGELTEGAMDDALRHAITKLSMLHLTSTADHRRRVIQLGEDPARVHFLGAPIVDALAGLPLLDRAEVARRFGVRTDRPYALVTFHPAAMDVLPAVELLNQLLAALLAVEGLGVIVTGSNTDIGSEVVRRRLAVWVAEHADRVDYVESFGQLGYLSAMAGAAVVAGNSSSTVLEAPVLGVPSVLVGDRQAGRPLASTVRTPEPDLASIAAALRDAVADGRAAHPTTAFGTAGFATRARDLLLDFDLPRPPRKTFHDMNDGSHG